MLLYILWFTFLCSYQAIFHVVFILYFLFVSCWCFYACYWCNGRKVYSSYDNLNASFNDAFLYTWVLRSMCNLIWIFFFYFVYDSKSVILVPVMSIYLSFYFQHCSYSKHMDVRFLQTLNQPKWIFIYISKRLLKRKLYVNMFRTVDINN